MGNEEKQDLIIIFKDKKEKKYEKFEKVCMQKDKLLNLIENYNKNEKHKDYAELVQDKFIYDVINDYYATKTYRDFISNVEDIIDRIDSNIDELRYMKNELEEIIEQEKRGDNDG